MVWSGWSAPVRTSTTVTWFKTNGASDEGFCARSRGGAKSSASKKREVAMAVGRKRFMRGIVTAFCRKSTAIVISARDGINAMEL
jgi:hypothetical protein